MPPADKHRSLRLNMADHEQSRLLKLPRELRDEIYSLIGVHRLITPRSAVREHLSTKPIEVSLLETLNLNLLLTCKKILEEYKETWMQSPGQLRFYVSCKEQLELTWSEISLHPTFPKDTLRHVRVCRLEIQLPALISALEQEKVENYYRIIQGMQSTEIVALPWTPSKGGCCWLSNLLVLQGHESS